MYTYLVSGLQVSSDIALPGFIPLDEIGPRGEAGVLDVAIRRDRVPAALDGATAAGPNWQMAGERFLLVVPGIARLLLIGGDEIRYQPEDGADPADAAVFLGGTGFGILLHQRGQIVLHASAVRVGDGAALFCGVSGAGKSTLAAALVDRGYPLLSDDFCAISLSLEGRPMVQPDGRRLKLWDQAIDRLALDSRRGGPVRGRLRKYYVEPRDAAMAPLPPVAIYMLREARPPLEPGLRRPALADGAALIGAHAYRPALVGRMEQAGLYFQASVSIAREAGIFTLTRAFNFDEMPVVIGWLEAHWRELGLLERAA